MKGWNNLIGWFGWRSTIEWLGCFHPMIPITLRSASCQASRARVTARSKLVVQTAKVIYRLAVDFLVVHTSLIIKCHIVPLPPDQVTQQYPASRRPPHPAHVASAEFPRRLSSHRFGFDFSSRNKRNWQSYTLWNRDPFCLDIFGEFLIHKHFLH